MSDEWLARLKIERQALTYKCQKLQAFMDTKVFEALPVEERSRMCRQAAHMRGYHEVLCERIEAAN